MHVSLSFYLSPQYASLINTVPHHDLAPPNKDYIIASARFAPSSHFSCPRALRVLMTSCACHSIPGWGAPSVIHPVLKASLRTNKMAHMCREDSVDTYLGVQIPDGQAVTVALRPMGRDAVQTHTHSSTHTHTFSPAHHTLLSLCTPQALPTLHRGSFPCGAAALPLTPPRPCFHPCSTAMGIISSTCAASIRRHAGACQPR